MNKIFILTSAFFILVLVACGPGTPTTEIPLPTQPQEATVEPTEAPTQEPTSTQELTPIPPTPSEELPAEPEVFISSGVNLDDLADELTIYEVLQANEDILAQFLADTTFGGFIFIFTDASAPLTVFASMYTLEDIDGSFPPTDQHIESLMYHVVPGLYLQADLLALDGQTIPTLVEGQEIDISVVDGVVYLNDVAMVIEADLLAQNGIIHVIDTFLVPPGD